jgi:subtilase family serine protease
MPKSHGYPVYPFRLFLFKVKTNQMTDPIDRSVQINPKPTTSRISLFTAVIAGIVLGLIIAALFFITRNGEF